MDRRRKFALALAAVLAAILGGYSYAQIRMEEAAFRAAQVLPPVTDLRSPNGDNVPFVRARTKYQLETMDLCLVIIDYQDAFVNGSVEGGLSGIGERSCIVTPNIRRLIEYCVQTDRPIIAVTLDVDEPLAQGLEDALVSARESGARVVRVVKPFSDAFDHTNFEETLTTLAPGTDGRHTAMILTGVNETACCWTTARSAANRAIPVLTTGDTMADQTSWTDPDYVNMINDMSINDVKRATYADYGTRFDTTDELLEALYAADGLTVTPQPAE